MALFPGLPGWASTRKVKPIWILLKQETVSDGGISWAICKSALCFRQISMPASHHWVFYRPDALPAAQPTESKHWRPTCSHNYQYCQSLRHYRPVSSHSQGIHYLTTPQGTDIGYKYKNSPLSGYLESVSHFQNNRTCRQIPSHRSPHF